MSLTKKFALASIVLLALTGCASRTGTALLVGGTVGYLIGQDQHKTPAPVVYQETVIVHPGPCTHYHVYSERLACERGVRQRLIEEQRRRDNDAYRQGYGR